MTKPFTHVLTKPETVANMRELAAKSTSGYQPYEAQIHVGRKLTSLAFFAKSLDAAWSNAERCCREDYDACRGARVVRVFEL